MLLFPKHKTYKHCRHSQSHPYKTRGYIHDISEAIPTDQFSPRDNQGRFPCQKRLKTSRDHIVCSSWRHLVNPRGLGIDRRYTFCTRVNPPRLSTYRHHNFCTLRWIQPRIHRYTAWLCKRSSRRDLSCRVRRKSQANTVHTKAYLPA